MFTDVSWADNDDITEQKLNTMQGNSDHLRIEGDARTIVAASVSMSGADFVKVNATTILSGGNFVGDEDISGLTAGLNTLTIGNSVFRFIKTPDMNRLTVWIYGNSAVAVAHRESQGWVW